MAPGDNVDKDGAKPAAAASSSTTGSKPAASRVPPKRPATATSRPPPRPANLAAASGSGSGTGTAGEGSKVKARVQRRNPNQPVRPPTTSTAAASGSKAVPGRRVTNLQKKNEDVKGDIGEDVKPGVQEENRIDEAEWANLIRGNMDAMKDPGWYARGVKSVEVGISLLVHGGI